MTPIPTPNSPTFISSSVKGDSDVSGLSFSGSPRQFDLEDNRRRSTSRCGNGKCKFAPLLGVQSRHLMDWIESESFGFGSSAFHDERIRCEAAQSLEAATKVVNIHEVGAVVAQLGMVVLGKAFDGRILDGAVHAFGLAIGPGIGPGVPDLGQPMFDAVFFTAHVKHIGHPCRCGAVGVTSRKAELDPIVGEDRVDLVGNRLDQGHAKSRGSGSRRFGLQPNQGEFACPINANEEIKRISEKCGAVFGMRFKCGIEGCNESRQSSSGSSVCPRKATMIAASSGLSTVDFGSLGPVGRSATPARLRHLATVFWFALLVRPSGSPHNAAPEASDSLDYAVITRPIASVVVALPCKTCPIAHPAMQRKTMHHQKTRSNS